MLIFTVINECLNFGTKIICHIFHWMDMVLNIKPKKLVKSKEIMVHCACESVTPSRIQCAYIWISHHFSALTGPNTEKRLCKSKTWELTPSCLIWCQKRCALKRSTTNWMRHSSCSWGNNQDQGVYMSIGYDLNLSFFNPRNFQPSQWQIGS